MIDALAGLLLVHFKYSSFRGKQYFLPYSGIKTPLSPAPPAF